MTHTANLRQTVLSVLAVMTALFGGSLAASAAETVTEGFDSFQSSYGSEAMTLPEDWYHSGSVVYFYRDNDTYKTERPSVCVEGTNTEGYLITPVLTGEFSFWLKNRTKNYQADVTVYACTFADGVMTLGDKIGTKKLTKTSSPSWEQVTFTVTGQTRVAILLSQAHFDDFTYTPVEVSEEAKLSVSGYASGDNFDFGTVASGATKTFLLSNSGKSELTISSITVTGGYTITAGADLTAIAAQGSAEVTIATPAADAEGLLTIVSNDTNSPYVINLKSTYKVPAPVMQLSTTLVNFGQVTADASQDITVSNTGDADLSVLLASSNDEFTVSKTALTVAPGASDVFTVTYHYDAAAYGGHLANIFVSSNTGDELATISVSAYVKDPNVWTEEFSGNVLPERWTVVGSAWTFTGGEAVGSYEPNGWLVTPKLTVKEGQQLTFQARSRQFGSDIIVQYQKDDGAWTQQLKEGRNTQTEYETYTIDGLEAGTYRFRIASENISLDNFEGFALAPSSATKETWTISYAIHYQDNSGNEVVGTDEEPMEIEFDGDDLSFNFPNPVNGNAWMYGSKYQGDGPTAYIFSSGQYIGKFGSEDAYYCGSNGNALVDMTFYYDEAQKAFFNFEHILINSSQTAVSYWGYFSDVVIYKDQKPTGIAEVNGQQPAAASGVYDLQGRRIAQPKHGLYIVNGKKVVIK